MIKTLGLNSYLAIWFSVCAFMQFVLFVDLLDEADYLIESLRDHELEQNKDIILGEWVKAAIKGYLIGILISELSAFLGIIIGGAIGSIAFHYLPSGYLPFNDILTHLGILTVYRQ